MIWMIAGALLIGISLGLMGSGGSILTVPILVYVLGHDKNISIAESMAIVGSIALIAGIPNMVSRLVDWRSVWFFGIPGMVGTFFGAWLGANYFSGSAKLFLFALVMVAAAWSMFRKKDGSGNPSEPKEQGGQAAIPSPKKIGKIAIEGTVVGVITGIVGVGGGFLIVPALVLLGGLPMRVAVGTSLMIITLKCGVGFAEYQYELLRHGQSVDWVTVVTFFVLGSVGSFVGRAISKLINQATLRKVFAVVLVVMAILILIKETPGVLPSTENGTNQSPTQSQE